MRMTKTLHSALFVLSGLAILAVIYLSSVTQTTPDGDFPKGSQVFLAETPRRELKQEDGADLDSYADRITLAPRVQREDGQSNRPLPPKLGVADVSASSKSNMHPHATPKPPKSRVLPRPEELRIMTVVLSGVREGDAAQRQAVIDTWADNDTFFVTRGEVDWPNVIQLPEAAEENGYLGLPNKVLNYLVPLMAAQYGDKYDYFVKADPDAYIYMPRLRSVLAQFDPDVIGYYGASMADQLNTPVKDGALYKSLDHVPFCHGGAAYVMSRALLNEIAKHTKDCMEEEPNIDNGWEDVKLGGCIYSRFGVKCMDLTVEGFDMMYNEENVTIAREKMNNIMSDPVEAARAISFHKVKSGEDMRYVHRELQTHRAKYPDVIHRMTGILSYKLQRWPQDRIATFDCTYGDASGKPVSGFCQRTPLRRASAFHFDAPASIATDAWWTESCEFGGHNTLATSSDVVFLDFNTTHNRGHLQNALRSLDEVASGDITAVIVTDLQDAQAVCDLVPKSNPGSHLRVVLLRFSAPQLVHRYRWHLQGFFALIGSYLATHHDQHALAMHAQLPVTFHSDPFDIRPIFRGVNVLLHEGIPSSIQHAGRSMRKSVFHRCKIDEGFGMWDDKSWDLWMPGYPALEVMMGTSFEYMMVVSELARYIGGETQPECDEQQVWARMIWAKFAASFSPIMLLEGAAMQTSFVYGGPLVRTRMPLNPHQYYSGIEIGRILSDEDKFIISSKRPRTNRQGDASAEIQEDNTAALQENEGFEDEDREVRSGNLEAWRPDDNFLWSRDDEQRMEKELKRQKKKEKLAQDMAAAQTE